MYSTVLSVLLMGMVPVLQSPAPQASVSVLHVASPSPLEERLLTKLESMDALTASGIVILDLESGQQVYGRNAERRHPMGSLTKLMTALLIVENHELTEMVKVTLDATKIEGTKASLVSGRRYSVGDLLSAMLIASGNDAAVTLSRYHSRSQAAFVRQMNARAASLGLRDTSFANSAGLDSANQWSTSRDMALLASYVLNEPKIRSRLSLPTALIHDTTGRAINLTNTNTLLHESNAVIAGKTGTTVAAGECLLSIIREAGREYAVVLLGSRHRYADMRVILDTLRQIFA